MKTDDDPTKDDEPVKEWVTVGMVQDALWDAYYHCELDEIAGVIEAHYIDGNDHPLLKKAAQSIFDRL